MRDIGGADLRVLIRRLAEQPIFERVQLGSALEVLWATRADDRWSL